MIKGRKVYDPLTNTWSTGYWILLYGATGQIKYYAPAWRDYAKNNKKGMD